MKKITGIILLLCMMAVMLPVNVFAGDGIILKSVNVTVSEPVAGEEYSTKATMREIEDVYLHEAEWEGTFGGEKNNVFIEGNTYKVTVKLFIPDYTKGKVVPTSGGFKINSYPIEEYELYTNQKGIIMSITYVCGEKKVKESTGSSDSEENEIIYDPSIQKIYGEFAKYAKYTPYYDSVDRYIEPMYRRESVSDYMECPEAFKSKKRPEELPLVATGILHVGDSGKQCQVSGYFAPTANGYARGHLLNELSRLGLYYNGQNEKGSVVNNEATYYYTDSKVDVIAYNDNWVAVWDEGMWTEYIFASGGCGYLYHGRYVKPGVYYYPREYVYILDVKNNSPKPESSSVGVATCLLAIKTAPESQNYIKSGVYKSNQAFQVVNEEPINGHYQVYYAGGLYYVNATWVNLKKKGVEKPVINYNGVLETSESSVSFYDQPNETGNLIGKGKKGMALEILEIDDSSEYAKIWFSSRECYVKKVYIKNAKATTGYRQSLGFKNPVGKLVMDTKWADARATFYTLTKTGGLKKSGQLLRDDAVNVYGVEYYEPYCSIVVRDGVPDMLKAKYKVIFNGTPGWIVYEGEIEQIPFTYYEGVLNSAQTIAKTQTIIVDGQKYDILACDIKDNNYFKIRDIAKLFSGSAKTFEVEWDEGAGCINMKSAFEYTPVGGELAQGDGTQKTAVESDAMLTYDGVVINAVCYNIDGNNYFKLRDITDALDCRTTWNQWTSQIEVSTMTPAKEDPNEIKG